MVPIDKAANNIAFISKNYYAIILLKEMVFIGEYSDTCEIINNHPIDDVKEQTKALKDMFKIDETLDLITPVYM